MLFLLLVFFFRNSLESSQRLIPEVREVVAQKSDSFGV
jgi:hypothetical protein